MIVIRLIYNYKQHKKAPDVLSGASTFYFWLLTTIYVCYSRHRF
jgi:hypothetical protein